MLKKCCLMFYKLLSISSLLPWLSARSWMFINFRYGINQSLLNIVPLAFIVFSVVEKKDHGARLLTFLYLHYGFYSINLYHKMELKHFYCFFQLWRSHVTFHRLCATFLSTKRNVSQWRNSVTVSQIAKTFQMRASGVERRSVRGLEMIAQIFARTHLMEEDATALLGHI